jgi:class I fructose-bisphosphate aldolase
VRRDRPLERQGSARGGRVPLTDTAPRLNRLFAADGKCFDVAVDHGFVGEATFLAGIEDMERVTALLVGAGPDAVQLSPGQARVLQRIRGRKPALVLRTDVANVYGREGTEREYLFSHLVEDAVEQAVRLDAACVVVNLLLVPGRQDLLHECIENVSELRAACDEVAMPLMVEPLAMRPGAGGYGVDGDVDKIVPLVRQAVELGADVVKADPTDDLDEYGRVLEAAGRSPVLVRGGGRVSDEEILRRTEAVMQRGAAGIVYGRNVIQHPDPAAMTRALMAVVHEGASAADALNLLAAPA